MAVASFPSPRTLVAVLIGLGLAGAAVASDSHGEPKPAPAKKAEGKVDPHAEAEAKPAAKGEPKADVKAEPKADAKAADGAARTARTQPVDPMDKLRERLAEKLGASKPHDAPSPNVLRVASRAEPAVVRNPHPSGTGGHGTATPSAATLAAAHREGRAAAPAAPHADAGGHAAHWSYSGEGGPEVWGQMKPEFAKCATGTRQSPIDIREGIKVELEPVQFDYRPTGFRVLDNGHTIQVNVGPGNSIEVQGRRFDLLQFHFHRPSEERINGRQFDMVAHLVHKDLDGRLAVVAVLLDRGAAQPLIQTVWNNLPLEKGEETAPKGSIDLNLLLPEQRQYYTYMGSLTTPPCSEGVLWMVMKKPVQISADQLGIFARMYPMNARPIQQAAGRMIKESN